MGNLKTSGEEKVKFINEVINVLDGGVFGGAIDSIRRQKTLDSRYKKAQYFNRTYELGVKGRKSDRFGESKRTKEEKQVKEEKKNFVVNDVNKESDEVFLEKINNADQATLTSDLETLTAPSSEVVNTSSKGVEVLQKALSKGCARFKLTALKVLGVELVELGDNDKEKYYIVDGINDLICVYE